MFPRIYGRHHIDLLPFRLLSIGIYQLRQNAKQYEVEHPEEMAAHRARKKALKEGTAVENVETTTE